MNKYFVLSLVFGALFFSCNKANKDNLKPKITTEKAAVVENYWKLATLFGEEVKMTGNQE